MINIKLLPLDERPCNLKFVEKICGYNLNTKLITPSVSILSKKKSSADLDEIEKFVLNDNEEIDYLILSMDMFLYGGLLPSRLHLKNLDQLKIKLNLLVKLKQLYPHIKIYGFSTIMRTPKYNSSDEEPEYYEQFGLDIFTKKYFEDKIEQNISLTKEEQLKLNSINIPIEFEQDYQNRRTINLNVNIEIIKLLKDGIFEYLIYPQDDSAPFGYTRIDQEKVYQSLANIDHNLFSVHPGADEVALTLLSRIYNKHFSLNRKIFIKYSNEKFQNMIPKYEDRELIKTLNLHLKAAGVESITNIAEATHILYYNVPLTDSMSESVEQDYNEEKKLDLSVLESDKEIFILDNCYSNGGDLSFVKQLNKMGFLNKISGYSAWNTNANALGTILCMISLSDEISTIKRDNFINERLIEDLFYQSITRKVISDNILSIIDLNYFNLKNKQEKIVELESSMLSFYFENTLNKKCPKFKHSHPWNRMFEIDIDVLGGYDE